MAGIALPRHAHRRVGAEGVARHAHGLHARLGPAAACRGLSALHLVEREDHVFKPTQQLLGPGCPAQPGLVAEAARHPAHGFEVAARVLQMHHHKSRRAPGLTPSFAARRRSAQAVREQHHRPAAWRHGHGLGRPADAHRHVALAGTVQPGVVFGDARGSCFSLSGDLALNWAHGQERRCGSAQHPMASADVHGPEDGAAALLDCFGAA